MRPARGWPPGIEAQLARAVEGVEGWFNLDEVLTLFDAALRAPEVDGRVDCVEIGSFKGRSTIALGTALELRGCEGVVLAIDPHAGEIHGERGDARLAAFRHNVSARDLDARVVQVRKVSHDAAPDVEPGSVSVLFIDGSHEYKDVLTDIRDWVPKLADGAVVLLNDPFHREVAWAIRDGVLKAGLPLRRPRLASNTLVFDHTPREAARLADRLAAIKLRLMLPIGWRLSDLLISFGTTRRRLAVAGPVFVRATRAVVHVLVPGIESTHRRGDG
jgi:predicted O-methyltransferase YrrM